MESVIISKRHLKRLVSLVIHNPLLIAQRISYDSRRAFADYLSCFGYCKNLPRVIFIAGMALSGSTWLKNLLGNVPGIFTRTTPMPHEVAYRQDICDSAFSRFPAKGHSLIKTHLNPSRENINCIKRNGVEKVVVTYRDLRDVVVSHYYRLIEFPKLSGAYDYIDYNAMEKEKAIDLLIEHTAKYFIPWIRGWLDVVKENPQCYHLVKFEQLKNDTKGIFCGVLNFYGIKLSDKKIDKIIDLGKGSKIDLNKLMILPKAYVSTLRSGKVGQWKEELTLMQIEKCKKLFGQTLIDLGYEVDLNWRI